MPLENSEFGRQVIDELHKLIAAFELRSMSKEQARAERRQKRKYFWIETGSTTPPAVSNAPVLSKAGEFWYARPHNNRELTAIVKPTHFDLSAFMEHLQETLKRQKPPKHRQLKPHLAGGWKYRGCIQLLAGTSRGREKQRTFRTVHVLTGDQAAEPEKAVLLTDEKFEPIAHLEELNDYRAFLVSSGGVPGASAKAGDTKISVDDHPAAEHAIRLIFKKQFVPAERRRK